MKGPSARDRRSGRKAAEKERSKRGSGAGGTGTWQDGIARRVRREGSRLRKQANGSGTYHDGTEFPQQWKLRRSRGGREREGRDHMSRGRGLGGRGGGGRGAKFRHDRPERGEGGGGSTKDDIARGGEGAEDERIAQEAQRTAVKLLHYGGPALRLLKGGRSTGTPTATTAKLPQTNITVGSERRRDAHRMPAECHERLIVRGRGEGERGGRRRRRRGRVEMALQSTTVGRANKEKPHGGILFASCHHLPSVVAATATCFLSSPFNVIYIFSHFSMQNRS